MSHQKICHEISYYKKLYKDMLMGSSGLVINALAIISEGRRFNPL